VTGGRPQGVLLDLDGVVYDGGQAIPGAADAVAELRAAGYPLLFVTNTSSAPRSALVEKLAGFGVAARVDDLWTPAAAARAWLVLRALTPVALFAPAALAVEFEGLDLLPANAESGAAAVVVGDLGEGWTFRELNRAFRLLHANPEAPLAALGMTRYWRAEDGLRLDVAPFVRALEYAADRQAVVTGKPDRLFFEQAARQLGVPPAELLMVGDDIRGDVAGAQTAGLSAALVRTGKFRERDLGEGIRPDAVFDSLADLPDWLKT
jgi:phospholysine phosphohistidine inorganic pyrophosphate phosphatase